MSSFLECNKLCTTKLNFYLQFELNPSSLHYTKLPIVITYFRQTSLFNAWAFIIIEWRNISTLSRRHASHNTFSLLLFKSTRPKRQSSSSLCHLSLHSLSSITAIQIWNEMKKLKRKRKMLSSLCGSTGTIRFPWHRRTVYSRNSWGHPSTFHLQVQKNKVMNNSTPSLF